MKHHRDSRPSVEEFLRLAGAVLAHDDVLRLRQYIHHRHTNRLSHCLAVSWTSYRIAARLGLDRESTVRGSLLHDFFWYDWLTEGPRLHGFRHPALSLGNAGIRFSLNARERDIIARHMWPLTPLPPRCAESWIVCLVDTLVTIHDYLPGTRPLCPAELRAIAEG